MNKFIMLIILILVIFSCNLGTTFDEVSKPYIQKYGNPEEENVYNTSGYHTIDWWWYTKGFNVTFMNERTSDRSQCGWNVLSEYSF